MDVFKLDVESLEVEAFETEPEPLLPMFTADVAVERPFTETQHACCE